MKWNRRKANEFTQSKFKEEIHCRSRYHQNQAHRCARVSLRHKGGNPNLRIARPARRAWRCRRSSRDPWRQPSPDLFEIRVCELRNPSRSLSLSLSMSDSISLTHSVLLRARGSVEKSGGNEMSHKSLSFPYFISLVLLDDDARRGYAYLRKSID